MADSSEMSHEQASELIKRYAEQQPIRVELTEEQYNAILGAWDEGDPRKPARITFQVKDRTVSEMMVAGYRYRGSTCCV